MRKPGPCGPAALSLALAALLGPACSSSGLKSRRDGGGDAVTTPDLPPPDLAPTPDSPSDPAFKADLVPDVADGPADRPEVPVADLRTDLAADADGPRGSDARDLPISDLASGEVRWVDAGPPPVEYPLPTPECMPQYIAAGPDGNLWFTEACNRIGKSTLTGKVTEYSLPTPESYPSRIVAGPDGNLWFIEGSGCRVGRITTQGVITEFPVPTAGCVLQDLVVGPDDNLWFTEIMGNKIGRMTVEGQLTEFAVPKGVLMPIRITVGPDRNLYFTSSGLALGRVTPAGSISIVPLPYATGTQVTADAIVTGPDDNLWIGMWRSDALTASLLRLGLDGTAVDYPILGTYSSVQEIIVGPDDNLWFALDNSDIVRFSTQGELTIVSTVNALSLPLGLTVGADGNIWFTAMNSNQIAYVPVTPKANSMR